MRHLRSDELVDLAEGARAESAAPHLRACDSCRRQLADLRSTMAAAARVEVPEPSPLFWDHLSERVREAVAADGVSRRSWWRPLTWPPLAVPAAAGAAAAAGVVAAIVFAALLTSRVLAPVSPAGDPASSPAGPAVLSVWAEFADDPSLSLVADLATQMDWDGDAASELTAPSRVGAADQVMGELSAGERIEMRRLLQAELARPSD